MHFRDGEKNTLSKLKLDFERDGGFFSELIADSAGGSLLFFCAALAFISEHICFRDVFQKKKKKIAWKFHGVTQVSTFTLKRVKWSQALQKHQ